MLNFDGSTVKHGTQNIQNDCLQWLSDSFRVHQIRFGRSSAQDPLAGLRGPTSKREREKEGERTGRRGEGRGGTGPPNANSWIRLWLMNLSAILGVAAVA